MAVILNIETSTEVCSVSLSVEGKAVQVREDHSGQNHALQLTRFIEEILSLQKMNINNIQAVSVSGGPGSYTGLRIGVSTAKGICYAAGLPLIAIHSLESMSNYVSSNYSIFGLDINEKTLFCPMIDARRMEVYSSLYSLQGKQVRKIQADIIDNLSFIEYLNQSKVLFFGNGASKCQHIIKHQNAIFIDGIFTSASYMAPLAEIAFQSGKFEDVAYYEPFYLKDFVATIPTKNIFQSSADH
jgi:tRNA threonylcarbamoyladenosine biosynthesis protein TsaB